MTGLQFQLATPADQEHRQIDRMQALERTTDTIKELSADQWHNSLEIGRQLTEMLQHRLWLGNPEVVAYAESSRQHIGGEALIARHLKAHGLEVTRAWIYQLTQAASLADQLQGVTTVTPCSERQVRTLIGVRPKLNAERLAELWQEAVTLAGGNQPTGAQVTKVVRKHYPSPPHKTRKEKALEDLRRLTEEELDEVLKEARARRRSK